ncbi:hypothetical protein UO65_0487 [Actinokineospora spheciospongiae]|uniref:Serine peptidase n=1 Tax=Actinokineospora spheciospongiae TaxID=909613 RepID=W7J5A1_9PSEU|nr:hypothetical protein UO65_0487 [Actinokineospora spheciospongiae]
MHGIGQQLKGQETIRAEWSSRLRDGARLAASGLAGTEVAERLSDTDTDIGFAFYGDAFRQPGQTLGVGDPLPTAADLTEYERELLSEWWRVAAETDPAVVRADERTLVRAPRAVQTALRVLSGSAFFAGLSERAMIGNLVQVRRYFTEPQTRAAIQQRVADSVDGGTRVIVAHSLGSVIAYEALCAHPEWPVRALVTLGSPLGVPNLIFDRLRPAPVAAADGRRRGAWPGSVSAWANVADAGDVVALVKDLRPLFGPRVVSSIVHNGAKAHDVRPYLTAPETGRGILAGLVDDVPESDHGG